MTLCFPRKLRHSNSRYRLLVAGCAIVGRIQWLSARFDTTVNGCLHARFFAVNRRALSAVIWALTVIVCSSSALSADSQKAPTLTVEGWRLPSICIPWAVEGVRERDKGHVRWPRSDSWRCKLSVERATRVTMREPCIEEATIVKSMIVHAERRAGAVLEHCRPR